MNAVTYPDRFPLPQMDYCIDQVGSTKVVILTSLKDINQTGTGNIHFRYASWSVLVHVHGNAVWFEKCSGHVSAADVPGRVRVEGVYSIFKRCSCLQ